MKYCYQVSIDDILKTMGSRSEGLSQQEADYRIEKYGWNELQEKPPVNPLILFICQFNDFLVWILLAAGGTSLLIGKWESSLVIFLVLILNALLGTFQHLNAEKSLNSLRKMSAPFSRVIRNGIKTDIPSRGLVPGDLMLLEAGDYIAADARVTGVYSLQVNESSLTGVSESVHKQTEAISLKNASIGDRMNMVHAGSYVTYGRGVTVVTATGMYTEIGRIAHLLESTEEKKTPLQISLDSFGQKLATVILVLSILMLALSVFRGQPTLSALMFAVSLAVAAIPEALSAIVTIVLAIGTQFMAKENAIVRELHTVESLGCISVICSDKTGTLTQNKMTVQNVFLDNMLLLKEELNTSTKLHRSLVEMAILCNDAVTNEQLEVGDPTEIALVKVGDDLGIDESVLREEHQRLQELPFDSSRKLMSTLNRVEGRLTFITKGAVDGLLNRLSHYETSQGHMPIDEDTINHIESVNEKLSQDGLRVLAFAYKPFEENRPLRFEDEYGLVFLGLIAMMDPPRPESAEAVHACIQAGIRPVMITGDHKVTASAIARQIGILRDGDMVMQGADVEALSDEALRKKVAEVTVYARVSPEHKIRIVQAWQANGHIVAMTGDGVNDAPALKQANIGIAMGIAGTEVSKEASSVILTDDNFSTIVKAIRAGRNIYNNIQNSILFLLSGNTAGILTVVYTSMMGLPIPFAPVHLLFINLVTDSLPAIAIGTEKHVSSVMQEKVRDIYEPIITRKNAMKILWKGMVISGATLVSYGYGLSQGDEGLAATMAFATFCLGKLFHSLDSRSKMPLLKQGVFTNPGLWGAILAGVILLHIVLFVPSLHHLFEITAPNWNQLGIIYGMSLLPLVLIEIYKHVTYHEHNR